MDYVNQLHLNIIDDTRALLSFTRQFIDNAFYVEYLSVRLKIVFVRIVERQMNRVYVQKEVLPKYFFFQIPHKF